jgi:hypothetical protein
VQKKKKCEFSMKEAFYSEKARHYLTIRVSAAFPELHNNVEDGGPILACNISSYAVEITQQQFLV